MPRRLVLVQLRKVGRPVCHLRNLPADLTAMPALAELELHGVSYMSPTHERELCSARHLAFARLTSLVMSCNERSLTAQPVPALYLWLTWALPAATQLRKLSISCDVLEPWAGNVPFPLNLCEFLLLLLCACVLGVSSMLSMPPNAAVMPCLLSRRCPGTGL